MADETPTAAGKPGRLKKVLFLDDNGDKVAEWASTQIPEDPFTSYTHGIQEPPLPLEQLVFLAEQHPVHNAALEQKAVDVVGIGWEWEKLEESASDSEMRQLDDWLTNLVDDTDDTTVHEMLLAAWLDLETVGHGAIEIARDTEGNVRHIYHIPGHTIRFHRDNIRVVQQRAGKRVWFKRWMPNDDRKVDRVTGSFEPKEGREANEILVIRRPSRRSSWYGIPTYTASIGWMALSVAARDDNIQFFNNRREPRWAIILKNLEDDPEMEDELRQAFTVDLKQPHRNLIVPIEGAGSIDFKQLSTNANDISFDRLQTRADQAILLSHRMPGDRLGFSRVGPLGGNVALATTLVYKEAVIQPSQTLLAARINRFVQHESGLEGIKHKWKPQELDLTSESEDVTTASTAFKSNLLTLNEARKRIKHPPLDGDRGEMLFSDFNAPTGGGDTTDTPLAERAAQLHMAIREEMTSPNEPDGNGATE